MVEATIIIPTYNRADFLPRAIDSALEQTFDDFELLIVDDGSTDETPAVVTEYDDELIAYISHEKNKGVSAARNTGISAANGEYIAFLDSDDELAPTFLETSIRTLRNEPTNCAGTCVTHQLEITYKKDVTEKNSVPSARMTMDVLNQPEAEIPRAGGLMVRSEAVSDVGYFDERLPCHEDVDYWIRLFQEGYYLVGIDEPLYRYYWHYNQHAADKELVIEGFENFFSKHKDRLPVNYRIRHRRVLGKAYARQNRFSDAAEEFNEAIRLESSLSTNYWYYYSSRYFPRLFFLPRYLFGGIRMSVRLKDRLVGRIRTSRV